ncbi:MAG: hypothetical protein RL684_1976 [Pseudomonadota bacterium]
MHSSDREEFDQHLSVLCAGFNVPIGDRSAAYWAGLSKMELATFARVVEHALGEDGPDKIPTTKQCWGIAKSFRNRFTPSAEPERPAWSGDRWDVQANLKMLDHIRKRPRRYAPDSGYDANTRQVTAGPISHEIAALIVSFKRSFCEDMRQDNAGNAQARLAWTDCLARMETEIDRVLARARVAAAA